MRNGHDEDPFGPAMSIQYHAMANWAHLCFPGTMCENEGIPAWSALSSRLSSSVSWQSRESLSCPILTWRTRHSLIQTRRLETNRRRYSGDPSIDRQGREPTVITSEPSLTQFAKIDCMREASAFQNSMARARDRAARLTWQLAKTLDHVGREMLRRGARLTSLLAQ